MAQVYCRSPGVITVMKLVCIVPVLRFVKFYTTARKHHIHKADVISSGRTGFSAPRGELKSFFFLPELHQRYSVKPEKAITVFCLSTCVT